MSRHNMGSGVSMSNQNPFAFKVCEAEYSRLKVSLEEVEEVVGMVGVPEDLMTDEQCLVRLKSVYEAAIQQCDLPLDECMNPSVFAYKLSLLDVSARNTYSQNVIGAQLLRDGKEFKPKAAAADYSKSFSGSAEDTKNEKEAAELMKGDGGEDEATTSTNNDMDPLLIPRQLSNDTESMKYDVFALRNGSNWLKFMSASGCFMYIHEASKEVVSVRPNQYDEDLDHGGGNVDISTLNAQNNLPETKEETLPEGCLTASLSDLPKTIEEVVANKRTPLILDTSEDEKVKTFMEYKSRLADLSSFIIPFAKSGLKRSDVLEKVRETLVGAIKSGTCFCLYMGSVTIEHANLKRKLCKKDVFPNESMMEAGARLKQPAFDPRYKLLFREADLEEGEAILRDGFYTVVLSRLHPKEIEKELSECIPLLSMTPIFIKL